MRAMDAEISPSRTRILALQKRSFDLTCAVVSSYPRCGVLDDPSRIIWRQLVKAVSSSTFNLEEADAASSDADFLAKMRIALREAKEARVAIRIIVRCKLAGYATVDRKSTRLNSSHLVISYAVFCLKKKK